MDCLETSQGSKAFPTPRLTLQSHAWIDTSTDGLYVSRTGFEGYCPVGTQTSSTVPQGGEKSFDSTSASLFFLPNTLIRYLTQKNIFARSGMLVSFAEALDVHLRRESAIAMA